MERIGIDVSAHQSNIDWAKVKEDGIEFAIIRISYGKKAVDKKAIRNIEACIAQGVPFGVYVYSYALNESDARAEAELVLKTLAPYKEHIRYPVYIDMEDADGYKKKNGFPSNETLVNICEIECLAFEEAGYYAGIYASKSWFDTYIKSERLNRFDKWIAWWNNDAKFDTKAHGLWQYTSEGAVNGISGRVDMNKAFKDYPAIISKMVKPSGEEVMQQLEKEIIQEIVTQATPTIQRGDAVRMNTRKGYDGKNLASWVQGKVFDVIQVKGDRVVIGKGNAVTAAVKLSDITKV